MGYKCGNCPGVEFPDKRGIAAHMELVHGSSFTVGDPELVQHSKDLRANPKTKELRALFRGNVTE